MQLNAVALLPPVTCNMAAGRWNDSSVRLGVCTMKIYINNLNLEDIKGESFDTDDTPEWDLVKPEAQTTWYIFEELEVLLFDTYK